MRAARLVKATDRAGRGDVFHGAQDIESGKVYAFSEEIAVRVVDDINAGKDTFHGYMPMLGQGFYTIEEVQS